MQMCKKYIGMRTNARYPWKFMKDVERHSERRAFPLRIHERRCIQKKKRKLIVLFLLIDNVFHELPKETYVFLNVFHENAHAVYIFHCLVKMFVYIVSNKITHALSCPNAVG